MRVQGTTTTHCDVEVRPSDAVNELVRLVFGKHGLIVGTYINRKGNLEIDHGGHGSGYQEDLGAPSDEQKHAIETCNAFVKLVWKSTP